MRLEEHADILLIVIPAQYMDAEVIDGDGGYPCPNNLDSSML